MQNALVDNFDIWHILDKYGYPTAILTLALLFIWNRQKKSDGERTELMERNNNLTEQLLNAVKYNNACKYVDFCKFYKQEEKKENDGQGNVG
jgi:hypothetical protein